MSSLKQLFVDLVEQLVQPRLDPLALYPARVVSQGDDGTLDLKPDTGRFGPGLALVPIRHGLPGVTVRVRPGARVLLGFDEGDVEQPYAALWEPGSLDTLIIEASVKIWLRAPSVIAADVEADARPVARVGDLVRVAFIMAAPGTAMEGVGYVTGGGTTKFKAS